MKGTLDPTVVEFEPGDVPQQAAKPNPLASIDWAAVGRADTELRTRAVGEVLRQAEGQAPDQAAEADKLSRLLGQPRDLVQRNLDTFRKQAASLEPDSEDLVDRAPKLAAWLIENADKAAILRDVVPATVELENKLSLGATLVRGWDQTKSMFWRFTQQVGDTLERLGVKPSVMPDAGPLAGVTYAMQRGGREFAEWNDERAKALGAYTSARDVKDLPSFLQWAKESLGTNLPFMAATTAGGLAGGVVGAAAGTARLGSFLGAFAPSFVLDVGETRGNLADLDPEAKAPWAIWVGGSAVAALDSALPAMIGSRLVATFGEKTANEIVSEALLQPVKPQFLRYTANGMVKGMVTEGFTEAVQEAFGRVAASIGADKPIDWAETWDAMKEAGLAGGLVGGVMGGGEVALEHHTQVVRYREALQAQGFFDALAAAGQENPLAQRSPEVYQELVAKMTEGGPVEHLYVPTDSFVEYWQGQNVSPALVAEQLTGNPKALEEAEAAGTDLAIPTAAYAAKLAATEHHGFFAKELKLRPEALNAREAAEVKDELENQAKTMQTALEQAVAETPDAELSPIRQSIVGQLVADPRFQQLTASKGIDIQAAARTYSAGLEAVFTNLGKRLGQDPVELFNRFGLRIGSGGPAAGVAAVEGPIGTPAAALATAASQQAEGTQSQGARPVRFGRTLRQGEVEPLHPTWLDTEFLRTLSGLGAENEAKRMRERVATGKDALGYERTERDEPLAAFLDQAVALKRGTLPFPATAREALFQRLIGREAADPAAYYGLFSLEDLDEALAGLERLYPRLAPNEYHVRQVGEELGRELFRRSVLPEGLQGQAGGERVLFQSVQSLEEGGWRSDFRESAEEAGYDEKTIADAMSLVEAAVQMFKAHPDVFPLEGGRKRVKDSKTGGYKWEPIRALVNNADFGVTLDVDRTCKRVLQFWNTVAAAEKKLKRPINENELLLLGQVMRADGDVPGCIFCYVEASRRAAKRNQHALATMTVPQIEKAFENDKKEGELVTYAVKRDELLGQLGWTLPQFAEFMISDQRMEEALEAGGPLQELAEMAVGYVRSAKGTAKTGTGTYLGEILRWSKEKVNETNDRAGLRWLSATDFDPTQLVDTLQALSDSTVKGLAGHEYTKEPWAVLILGKTGIKQNMSIAVNGRIGPFRSDDVNGMPIGVALRLRGKFRNAGTMLVAKNLEQIVWGLSSPDIDMMIPHHAANWTGGAEKYGKFDLDDFSSVQHESWADTKKAAKQHAVGVTKKGEAVLDPKTGKQKMRVQSPKEVFGRKLWFSYWLRRADWNEQQAAQDYLAFCRRNNLTPKFDKGTYQSGLTGQQATFPGFTEHPGYAKLLKDFARTDSPQEAVDVTLVDNNRMARYLDRYAGGDSWQARSGASKDTVKTFVGLVKQGPVTTDTLAAHEHQLRAKPVPLNWVDTPMDLGLSSWPLRTARTVRIGARSPGLLADVGPEDAGDPTRTFFQSAPALTQHEVFTSRLTQTVQASQQAKASGAQWKAMIRNSKLGVNAEEFAFAHVDDLEDGTTYTKQEVLDYLKTNQLQVTWKVLGAPPMSTASLHERATALHEAAIRQAAADLEDDMAADRPVGEAVRNADGTWEARVNGEVVDEAFPNEKEALAHAEAVADSRWTEQLDEWAREARPYDDYVEAARQELEEEASIDPNRAQFEDYTYRLSLAEPGSYREVFLTAPQFATTGYVALSREENEFLRRHYPAVLEDLRHLQFTGRDVAADDAQLGAAMQRRIDRLLKDNVAPRITAILEKLRDSGNWEFRHAGWKDGHAQYAEIENPIVRLRFDTRTLEDGRRVLFLEEVQPPQEQNFGKMPALLQKNWRELGMKWALRYAADNNLAAVAWTTGDMQADRYDLAQGVDAILWEPTREFTDEYDEGGRTALTIELAVGGNLNVLLDEGLRVVSVAGRDEVLRGTDGWVGQPIDAVIGKDLAQRLLEGPSGQASGAALKIGGEGLRRLYDVDFRNVVNKLAKKAGGRVGELPIISDVLIPPLPANGGRVRLQTQTVTTPVPAIELSDALRTQVLAPQALFQGERGRIRVGANRQMQIDLLKDADLSTFLHETAHFYLEVLGDVVAELGLKDPATLSVGEAVVQRDFKTILAWLGVADRQAITVDQHEQFARGFEAYLMEGQAPSVELRGAFARFRAWLTTIYKTADALNVQLSDEVRGVFDRLLAGDEAIAAAREEAQLEPLFATAEEAGMTEAEFQLYRKTAADAAQAARDNLAAKLLQEYRRERSKAYRARRAVVEGEVRAQLLEQPVYRALNALQRGEWPDGTPLGANLKLSKQDLVAKWGKDILAKLPLPWVYTTEGGIDPDAVAELFGFTSGDELVKALASSEKLEAVVGRQVQERMRAEFGDLRQDGSLREFAKRAVQALGHEKVLEAELRAVAKKAREVGPFVRQAVAETKATERERAAAVIDPMKAEQRQARSAQAAALRAMRDPFPLDTAREIATARIAKMRLRDLRPQEFWVAARQAGQRALEAAVKKDYVEAVAQKQRQLLAVELYKAANEALDESRRLVRFAQRFEEKGTRARLGRAGHTYLDQVDAILGKFEFANVSNRDLSKRATLMAWLEEQQQQGLPVDGIPAETIEAAQRTNYRTLTLEQLRDVRDTLKQIEHLARLKNTLLRNAKDRDFVKVRDAVVAQILTNKKKDLPLEYRPKDKRRAMIADWFASHAKIAILARHLDGHRDGGPLWSAIIRPLNEAADVERQRRIVEGKKYAAILEAHYPGQQLGDLQRQLHIPAIGASLSKEARLAVALNWGNETSRERLLNDPVRKWSEAQVKAILDTLDRRDWQFVQATWDYVNTYWQEIAEKQKRVTGLAPEKVEAAPVVTPHGTFAGGYYPLAYDHRMSARAGQVQQAGEAKLAMQAAYVRTTTRRGHVETRKQHTGLPVRLELSVMFEHLDRVIHDLTHHEVLIDVGRILRDKAVSGAMLESVGEPVYKQFTNALTAIATNGRPGGEASILDKSASWMKTGTQISALGLNLWTALQQPFGVFNGMQRVGAGWVMRGLVRWLGDAATMTNTAAWINERSLLMRNRATTANQDLNELHRTLSQPGGWFDNMVRTATRGHASTQDLVGLFLWHIGQAQRAADIPTWLGMYEKAMAGGQSEADAVALADQAVLDSQGGGEIKDLAAVQRGGPIARLLMTFYSYGNTLYNATRDAAGQTTWKNPLSVAHFLMDLGLIYVMPSAGAVLMSHLFGRSGNDDDDLDPIALIEEIGVESLSAAMNTMVLVRELSGLLRTGGAARGWQGPTGARALQLVYTLANQAQQGEVDAGLWKALNATAGLVFRYPSTQVQKTIDGWVALEEGRTSNPLVLLTGPPARKK